MVITSEVAEHMGTYLTSSFPFCEGALPQEQDGVNLSAEPYSEDEYLKLLRVLHTGPGCLSHRSDFMEAFV
jgi:hypothetical protein